MKNSMNRSSEMYTNWMLLGTFLVVFSSMLWTVENFGTSIPYYDEWDAEADWLYRKYENSDLGISEILAPHNGHRLVLTRLTSLALYVVNVGWDPQLQMIINALLHAIICAVLVRFILLNHHSYNPLFPVVLTVILFAVPFSWISITVAFQTQFYLMILFSILALQSLANSQYIFGYSLSILAMLSMTPGAFVFPAFVGAILASAVQSRVMTKWQILQCMISISLFTLFILTLHEEPAAQVYHAQHIRGFLISILAAISWPFRVSFVIGLVIYVPLAVYLTRSILVLHGSPFILSLGVFIACQILAMAYFRGGEGVPPANRYWEIMIVGIWINGMCAWHMVHQKSSKFAKHAAALWLFIAIIGLSIIGYQSFSDGLPNRKADALTAQSLILEYLETGNRNIFLGKNSSEISYLDTDALVALLDDKQIREILPSSLGGKNADSIRPIKAALFAVIPATFLLGLSLISYSIIKSRFLGKGKIYS